MLYMDFRKLSNGIGKMGAFGSDFCDFGWRTACA